MLIVDVETTGLDPLRCSIISIGAVDFADPSATFYAECRAFDGAVVSSDALAINGFTREQIQDLSLPDLSTVLSDFLIWAQQRADMTIAGGNPSFDRDFLHAAFDRCGIRATFGYRTVDLHSLVFAHHLQRHIPVPLFSGRTTLTVDLCFMYVGLPPEPKPHNALVGAKMEAEAFSRLILGKGLFAEFSQDHIPQYLVQ